MEEEEEDIFDNIDDVLSNLPSEFNILEEEIDVEIQKEFYEASKDLKTVPMNEDDIATLIEHLQEPFLSTNERKESLMELSFCDSVKAYRALEEYKNTTSEDMKPWAILALQQSRMVVQSSLLGEQQVFISTGLGGRSNKLRYFIIFPFNSGQKLYESQISILRKELEFFLTQHDAELEQIEFFDEFATATTLIPLTAPISEIIRNIMEECNQYGNFLSQDILITNMKKFNKEEINELIKNHEEPED
jgi:hypothetical protein